MMQFIRSSGRAVVRAGKTEVGVGIVIVSTAIALLALTTALVIGFRQWVTNVDTVDHARERQLVANYLDRSGRASIAQQKVQLTRDDGFRAVAYERDFAWADTFLGDFLWTNFKYDHQFLVSPKGEPIRAWKRGKPSAGSDLDPVAGEVAAGLRKMAGNGSTSGQPAQLRKLADTAWPFDARGRPLTRWSTALVQYRGKPAILTMASILPGADYGLLTRTPNHLVAIRFLDGTFLAEMSEALLLGNVGFSQRPPDSSEANSLELTGAAGGRFGWLHWQSVPLSAVLERNVTPLFMLYVTFLLVAMGGGGAIVRALMRAMKELETREAQTLHASLHDALTGLPNRAQFFQRLSGTLASRHARDDDELALVAYIDLDNFKDVNDMFGHELGDALICQVAARLQRMLPETDYLARHGGDEFVLIRQARRGSPAAESIGDEIMALFKEPFAVLGHDIDVTASCGISTAPQDGKEASDLLRSADIALFRAKQRGRGRWRSFTPEMHAAVRWRHDLEADLRKAIASGEGLSMVYQPIVGADNGRIAGFEALLRWTHPERGAVGPDVFVPIAEQSGLMGSLGRIALRRTFADIKPWKGQEVSVNLSPLQIMARGFLDELHGLVAEFAVDPRKVIFEVTEGVLLDRSAHVLAVLGEVRAMGFRIALDDFGTGYSSLSYLRSFPFDRIKIDKSFIQNIENDLDAQAILKAIVGLGKTLKIKIVAEGVETLLQRQLVQSAGCDLIQGYLFWHGLTPAQVAELLERPEEVRTARKRAYTKTR